MNARRVAMEDRVMVLADALEGNGQRALADTVRQCVPTTFALQNAHEGVLKNILHRVADTDAVGQPQRVEAVTLLGVLTDLPAVLGRRGLAAVVWRHDGYTLTWEEGTEFLECGPDTVVFAEAMAWALRRSDRILARTPVDPYVDYSAGPEPIEGLPPLHGGGGSEH
jgi:hypothetical protein